MSSKPVWLHSETLSQKRKKLKYRSNPVGGHEEEVSSWSWVTTKTGQVAAGTRTRSLQQMGNDLGQVQKCWNRQERGGGNLKITNIPHMV
jgi:hypothetical protein